MTNTNTNNLKLTTMTKAGKVRYYQVRANGNPASKDGSWKVGGKYCGETITVIETV